MLDLFEEVKDEQYVWKGFFLGEGLPCKNGSMQVYQVENVKVEKLLATGIGLNMKDEDDLLTRCKNTRIFTREIEFALLSDDREMYLYSAKNGESVDIRQLGVVGKYVFISDKEVASPVFFRDGDGYTDEYFPVLKTYVLTGHAETDGYVFDYRVFVMTKDGEIIIRMTGADAAYTYPFVLYILRKLASFQPRCGFESGIDVKRIRKLTTGERR